MDKGKTIMLKGITRNPYIFTLTPWGSKLRSMSAVYAVLRRNHYGYQVVYISSTCELDRHLTQHPKLAEFDREGITHIGVHIEPVMSRRHAKETDLIASYAPVLNSRRQVSGYRR